MNKILLDKLTEVVSGKEKYNPDDYSAYKEMLESGLTEEEYKKYFAEKTNTKH